MEFKVNIVMTDEGGRVIAQGSGEHFLKSLSSASPVRNLTPMRVLNIEGGHSPIPLLKAHSTQAEQVDAVIAEAQRKYGRFQVLRRLEELGLV